MYRAIPVMSRSCENKWQEHRQSVHINNIKKVKAMTDTSTPMSYHINESFRKGKAQQLVKERNLTIQHDNALLLNKISEMVEKKKKIAEPMYLPSLNTHFRKKQQVLIEQENRRLFSSLQRLKPQLNQKEWKNHEVASKRYYTNAISFPDSLHGGLDNGKKSSRSLTLKTPRNTMKNWGLQVESTSCVRSKQDTYEDSHEPLTLYATKKFFEGIHHEMEFAVAEIPLWDSIKNKNIKKKILQVIVNTEGAQMLAVFNDYNHIMNEYDHNYQMLANHLYVEYEKEGEERRGEERGGEEREEDMISPQQEEKKEEGNQEGRKKILKSVYLRENGTLHYQRTVIFAFPMTIDLQEKAEECCSLSVTRGAENSVERGDMEEVKEEVKDETPTGGDAVKQKEEEIDAILETAMSPVPEIDAPVQEAEIIDAVAVSGDSAAQEFDVVEGQQDFDELQSSINSSFQGLQVQENFNATKGSDLSQNNILDEEFATSMDYIASQVLNQALETLSHDS